LHFEKLDLVKTYLMSIHSGKLRDRGDKSVESSQSKNVENDALERPPREVTEESEHEDDTDSDEEEEESANFEEGSFLQQHGLALLVGFVASVVGYYFLNPDFYSDLLSGNLNWQGAGTSLSGKNNSTSMRHASATTQEAGVQNIEGPSYKRTWGVNFCLPTRPDMMRLLHDGLDDEKTFFKSDFCTSRVVNSKYALGSNIFANEIQTGRDVNAADPLMKYHNISVPKELLNSLLEHFAEDYPKAWKELTEQENPLRSYKAVSAEHIPVKMYMEPSIGSLDKSHGNGVKELSSKLSTVEEYPNQEALSEEVMPIFNGFAAKVINLSYKPVNLWWDGGYVQGENGKTVKHDLKIATIAPFEAVGTATFPGHQFYLTPTYDSMDTLDRFVLTNEERDAIHIFDPFEKPPTGSGVTQYKLDRLSKDQRRKYDMQKLNKIFARDYRVATGRTWYGMFPRPPPSFPMWSADYFGQIHTVKTLHNHYHTIPPKKQLSRLKLDDMNSRDLQHHTPNYKNAGELTLKLNVISCRPRVFEIDRFLSQAEVNHLLHIATKENKLKNSTVSATGDSATANTLSDTRSSTNTWIYREQSYIVDTIYRRAADVLQINESLLRDHLTDNSGASVPLREQKSLKLHQEWSGRAEALQIVRYKAGQMYTAHHDFTFPEAASPYQPTRYATILLYLNGSGDEREILDGGQTAFPRARNAQSSTGITVTPEGGKAVLFYNMLPDGNMDDLSQHASLPVKSGEKWLANLWVWDPVIH